MKKWFRIATEGATTDGRKITRAWLEQMASNFDPKKYGARIWMEHIRGLYHDSAFQALGDVVALKTEEVEDEKLGLFAQLDPTSLLKEINKKRQKIYTSIEVDTEFADSGEAYLVGLAVTDSPASLGTSMLEFSSQQGDASPLMARKQRPENIFTAAVETEFDFTEEEDEGDEETGPSLMDSVKALFKRQGEKTKGETAAFRKDLEKTLGLFVTRCTSLESGLEERATTEEFGELKSAHEDLKKRFDELYSKLDMTPDTPPRSNATGADGAAELTDC